MLVLVVNHRLASSAAIGAFLAHWPRSDNFAIISKPTMSPEALEAAIPKVKVSSLALRLRSFPGAALPPILPRVAAGGQPFRITSY